MKIVLDPLEGEHFISLANLAIKLILGPLGCECLLFFKSINGLY